MERTKQQISDWKKDLQWRKSAEGLEYSGITTEMIKKCEQPETYQEIGFLEFGECVSQFENHDLKPCVDDDRYCSRCGQPMFFHDDKKYKVDWNLY